LDLFMICWIAVCFRSSLASRTSAVRSELDVAGMNRHTDFWQRHGFIVEADGGLLAGWYSLIAYWPGGTNRRELE